MNKQEKNQKIIEGLNLLKQERENGKRLQQDVFYAFCEAVITCPVEVIPVTANGKVLMFLRDDDDKYFRNVWHTCGSIQLPRETIKQTLRRVLDKELDNYQKIGEPKFIGILENDMGDGEMECPREQERSVVYIQEIKETENNSKAAFFGFDEIPVNSIKFHRAKLIPKAKKFLNDGKIEITYADH